VVCRIPNPERNMAVIGVGQPSRSETKANHNLSTQPPKSKSAVTGTKTGCYEIALSPSPEKRAGQ
jgi:hypothetical protein